MSKVKIEEPISPKKARLARSLASYGREGWKRLTTPTQQEAAASFLGGKASQETWPLADKKIDTIFTNAKRVAKKADEADKAKT